MARFKIGDRLHLRDSTDWRYPAHTIFEIVDFTDKVYSIYSPYAKKTYTPEKLDEMTRYLNESQGAHYKNNVECVDDNYRLATTEEIILYAAPQQN